MYGEYDPHLIYGIEEKGNDIIDNDWLMDNFPSISIYASSVVKHYSCSAIYGIPACIKDGKIYISSEAQKNVDKLYKKLNNNHSVNVGFYLAISGNFTNSELDVYIPR